ncbi:MAG: Plug domain-containing protein [Gemmatimonadota bacterium]
MDLSTPLGARRLQSGGTFLAAALLLTAPACTMGHSGDTTPGPRSSQTITREQIAQTSATSGWEVLSILGRHLNIREGRDGAVRSGRVTSRGATSIYLRTDPLLVVDGVEKTDVNALRDIPARDIEEMRLVSALEASTFYGLHGGGGLVMVSTRETGRVR